MSAARNGFYVLFLFCPLTAVAQPYVFENSHYAYLPSPWFRIEGCEDQKGCEFLMSGVMVFEDLDEGESLMVASSELQLEGDPRWQENPRLEGAAIRGEDIAPMLNKRSLVLEETDAEISFYRWTSGNLKVTLSPRTVHIEGGYDQRPADGDGVLFDAQGIRTWFGDANLDLQFDSKDFVQVFQAGEYEDDRKQNSTWSTGDWNGDGEFTSSDLVLAFQDNENERIGGRVIPEPASIVLVVLGAGVIFLHNRSG